MKGQLLYTFIRGNSKIPQRLLVLLLKEEVRALINLSLDIAEIIKI
jgi:hypothetical protein